MSMERNILEDITDKFLPESFQEVLSIFANLCTIGSVLYPIICVMNGILCGEEGQNLKNISWNSSKDKGE